MMAAQHVTSSAAVYVTVVGTLRDLDVAGLGDWSGAGPAQLVLGTVLVAAGALVPDLDHHGSTLTKKLGPAGKGVYLVSKFLGGGHRAGMHSITFVVGMGVLFYLANFGAPVAAVLVALSALLVAKFVLPFGTSKNRLLVYGGVAALVALLFTVDGVMSGYWLPVAAAVGPLLHDLGDMLTRGKVKILWPFVKEGFRFPFSFPTNGFFELRILAVLFPIWMFSGLAFFAAGPLLGLPTLPEVLDPILARVSSLVS